MDGTTAMPWPMPFFLVDDTIEALARKGDLEYARFLDDLAHLGMAHRDTSEDR